jgi:phosphatidylserine decarboxylase
MDEYEDTEHYASFNEFFIRKFKNGARKFTADTSELPAFAEGRYFAFEKVGEKQVFPIKGKALSPEALLGSAEKARPFLGGPAVIARLCPTDYHRFHFPDDGRTLSHYTLHGRLHSVNPIALRRKKEVFIQNERQISILETTHFGKLAYIEVGALCVGRIVQTHPSKQPFHRGDEKGYFLFGGSTVIILGEPGCWKPDVDLLAQTTQGIETFVRLGERIASIQP